MQFQDLATLLNLELRALPAEQQAADCLRADFAGHYALDAAGEVVAINLRGMELRGNPGEWLDALPHLRYLNLSRCGLLELRIPNLPELLVLDLSQNDLLTTVQLPATFPKLLRADLGRCNFSSLHWPACPRLEWLDASRQQEQLLKDWQFTGHCPRLQYLYLREAGLESLMIPAGFEQLKVISLAYNGLEKLEIKGELPALEDLDLAVNRLKIVDHNWLNQCPGLVNLWLRDNNQLDDKYRFFVEGKSSTEVISSLRAFFANEAKGTTPDNECKVLLIGNGRAGKSCIVYRLREDEFCGDLASTDGIELYTYPYEGWQLMFWDFGGQDIYHATHRLFMQADAVYLLVWSRSTDPKNNEFSPDSNRADAQPYRNFSLDYWVHYARVLGKGSPLILVQTHRGQDGVLDLPRSHRDYAEGFTEFKIHQIESAEDDWDKNGYDDLLRNVRRAVEKIKAQKCEIASNYAVVRAWLREKQVAQERVLPISDYLQYAEEAGVVNPMDALESLLHKSGVVFYDKRRLPDQIILNQSWAIEAIYALFDRNGTGEYYRFRYKNKGRFTGADLRRVWSNYPLADPPLFLQFMLACEICFEVDAEEEANGFGLDFDRRSFIAPGLLEDRQPEHVERFWIDRPAWHLRYTYPFLHFGIIQHFIVRSRGLANTANLWQTGTELQDGKQIATVAGDLHGFSIRVTQNGKSLLDKIRNLITEIQDEEPTQIDLSYDGKNFIDLTKLEVWSKTNNPTIDAKNGEIIAFAPFSSFLTLNSEDKFASIGEKQREMPASFIEQIRTAISKSQLDTAFQLLLANASGPWANEAVILQQRYEKLEQDDRIGILGRDEGNRDRNKIVLDMLTLVERMQGNSGKEARLSTSTPGPISTEIRSKQVLFICSSPSGPTQLNFGREFKKIEQARQISDHRDDFAEIVIKMSVEASEFVDLLTKYQPDILHIALHGSKKHGLYFEDNTGKVKPVTPERFARTIELYHSNKRVERPIETIVLSACDSLAHAQAVLPQVKKVVGMRAPIYDRACAMYADKFYRMLFEQEDLVFAHNRALFELEGESFPPQQGVTYATHEIPVLLENTNP